MSFAERLSEIRASIQTSCARAGRDSNEVRILAVSKLQPIELIKQAYDVGVRDFGENYVQELIEKREKLADLPGIQWHLIGHLQTNKLKQALEAAHFYHALDSERMVREIAKKSVSRSPWPVFIQVNLDGEATKSGVSPDDASSFVRMVRAEPALKLMGLMCIPEPKSTPEAMRPAFKQLAELAKALSAQGENPLQLSMGMSSDFEVAIEEGAHWVRIGTKLFGERPQRR